MESTKLILVAVFSVILIAGCVEQQYADDTGWSQKGVDAVVNANNKFAFELYEKLAESETGNIFLSPYSISTALAITYEGARGQTAAEMQNVLHFPDSDIMRPNFARIYNELNSKGNYELHTANALWAQENFHFLDEYFNITKRYYAGKVTNLDFSEREKSVQIINSFIEEQTNNKIKNLIQPSNIDPVLTKLIITNAIYFKGRWVYEFDKSKTREMDFKTPEGIKKVQMMFMEPEESFNYTETDKMQILELPYKGNKISMLIILPKQGWFFNETGYKEYNYTLNDIEFTQEKLKTLKMKETKLDEIYLPKFKFETRYELNDYLKDLGMPTAFTYDADFSGMTGKKDLYIDFVIHKAYIDVNEEGTEAAAATAVGMFATAMTPTKVFKADHPFLFIIQEKKTGNILFLGRVVNPIYK